MLVKVKLQGRRGYHEKAFGKRNNPYNKKLMGIDYSTARLGRNRLREKLKDNKHLSQIIKRISPFVELSKAKPDKPE